MKMINEDEELQNVSGEPPKDSKDVLQKELRGRVQKKKLKQL